jgi:hypothetical protein
LQHDLSWYDTLALAAFRLWPVVLPLLLWLAWYGWRRRHWTGWLILVPAVMAAVVVTLAAIDTA